MIKDEKAITEEYVKELHDYIIKNQTTFFNTRNKAIQWSDFDLFQHRYADRAHLIMPGEVSLIDRLIDGVHCWAICKITARKKSAWSSASYADIRRRSLKGEYKGRVWEIAKVIEMRELGAKNRRNGCFLLPDLEKINIYQLRVGEE